MRPTRSHSRHEAEAGPRPVWRAVACTRTRAPGLLVRGLLVALAALALACESSPELPVAAAGGGTTPPAGPMCGDGVVQPAAGEQCDDGANVDGDGCSAACQLQDRVTIFGGSREDSLRDVAVAADGWIYVAGGTNSDDFPVTVGAWDTTFDSGSDGGSRGAHDVVVARFTREGQLDWATFVGGGGYDRAYAVEVDATGVYVAGRAGIGFPTTLGVLQRTFAGDTSAPAANRGAYGRQDGFVLKLSLDGRTLLWSTYFGDDGPSFPRDMTIDADGDVYLAQNGVRTTNPHVTPGAYLDTRPSSGNVADSVIAKIAGNGASVIWATYLGGSGEDLVNPAIRVDAAERVFVAGETRSSDYPVHAVPLDGGLRTSPSGPSDMAVTALTANGRALLFSGYLGGSGPEETETHCLALIPGSNLIVSGTTGSSDFPTTPLAFQPNYGGGMLDGFVTELSATTGAWVASTFIGGSDNDALEGVAVDPSGAILITGVTRSANFPVSASRLQDFAGGPRDQIVALFDPGLATRRYATFVGGSDTDSARAAAFAPDGTLVAVGHSDSSDYPTTDGTRHTPPSPAAVFPEDMRDDTLVLIRRP